MTDDAFQEIFAACISYDLLVPLIKEVVGLVCLSKGMQQQLHRLRPLVGVQSLIAMQRSTWPCNAAFHPWRVMLLYKVPCGRSVSDSDMEAILSLTLQGCVHSIDVSCHCLSFRCGGRVSFRCGDCKNADSPLTLRSRLPRMVPKLLGVGCSLLELDLSWMPNIKGTWASTFGEAAVCSAVLRKLRVAGEGRGSGSGLRGPLPELRLPARQELNLRNHQFTGGLEPLQFCTGLQTLEVSYNLLEGGLEPLQFCTGLQTLEVSHNLLEGGFEPLQHCTGLQTLRCSHNHLKGDLEPLQGCTALKELRLHCNQLTGTLEPLRGCTALHVLYLVDAPTEQDMAHFNWVKQCFRARSDASSGDINSLLNLAVSQSVSHYQ